jgi:hypothetical protein
MPFVATPLPRIDGFIPALETAIVIADITTSALLFAQFSIVPRLALLVLASGFLLSGLIVVPHALSFPGAFSPTGLLRGGAQSTAWLYHLWKVSLPTAVIVYVLLRDADIEKSMPQRPPVTVVGCSAAAVILIAYGLTWLAAEEWLPRIGVTVSRHLIGALDNAMTLSRLRPSIVDARDLAEAALRGIGYQDDEARIIADHVIDALQPALRLAPVSGAYHGGVLCITPKTGCPRQQPRRQLPPCAAMNIRAWPRSNGGTTRRFAAVRRSDLGTMVANFNISDKAACHASRKAAWRRPNRKYRYSNWQHWCHRLAEQGDFNARVGFAAGRCLRHACHRR